MSYCYLSGPIHSSLSNLRSLSVMHLDFNNLSASVPKFFAEFENLTSLRLSATRLRGRLPEEIFQIPTLQILDLSYYSKVHFQIFHSMLLFELSHLASQITGGKYQNLLVTLSN
ncbi:hypothetical protein Golob_006864 [Gossypium lobatum]|uniref:Uncharacterized protein n=1 Tax=Gossypium lobatum TaxID=34289 RepID=A0A7J8NDJ6_9ROSI|nr:hypothetical protein [Gossypium lobatum]